MKQLSKDERKVRSAFSKEVAAELRRLAKASGWKAAQGWLFREDEGWFVDAWCTLFPYETKTTIALHMKPMGVDPIFWEIAGTPDNVHQPLSFRLFGAWTVSTPPLSEITIDDSGMDVQQLTGSILAIANGELLRLRERRSVEHFLESIGAHRNASKQWSYLPAAVCAHILCSDHQAAMAELLAARDRSDIGGFLVGTRSFVDLAIEWLRSNTPARH